MNGIIYAYHDGKGHRYTFNDALVADRSYRAFLRNNGLRLRDLKRYAENNRGFKPLAAYEKSTGLFIGWLERYPK